MIRTIAAVLGGWGAVGVLVVATDVVLGLLYPFDYQPGQIPPPYLSAVSLVTSVLYSVFGGWLTARIAARKHWAHILAVLLWGEAMGITSTILTWHQMPHWYQLGLLFGWIPAICLGGYFRIGNLRFRA
jgi:hypothetical protein